MDYYSAIKRTEILIHAAIWMNLGNTTKWKKPDPKAICCVTQFMLPQMWHRSQLQLRFNLCARNTHMLQVWPPNK